MWGRGKGDGGGWREDGRSRWMREVEEVDGHWAKVEGKWKKRSRWKGGGEGGWDGEVDRKWRWMNEVEEVGGNWAKMEGRWRWRERRWINGMEEEEG